MAKRSTKSTMPAKEKPESDAIEAGPVVRKPDLIDRVVERSGAKKRDVKPIMEAALAVIGEALEAGEMLNVPPLGKVKVTRQKGLENAEVITCRLRRSHQLRAGQEVVETPEE